MAPILKLHKVEVGSQKYYCLLPPRTYAGIGSTVGITLVTEEAELNSPSSPIASLIHAGIVFRLLLTSKTSPKRYYNVLCARDKVAAALDGVVGKSVNGVAVGAAKGKATSTFR